MNSPEAVRRVLDGEAPSLLIPTSGSTGTPRHVILSRAAIVASAQATAARLGGGGQWMLAVPTERVAGAMVLARSHLAGTTPVRLGEGPFTADAFARATDLLTADRAYVSLVPTQLERVLESGIGAAALERYAAVLVGGAPSLRDELPANVVRTYGSTETSGGCVYDGRPLEGVELAIRDGLVCIAGPMLADGYLDGDDSAFTVHDGRRWLVTQDLGEIVDGTLRILGRADDVINTGGFKVHPLPVERALHGLPWVREAIVVGVPDAQWGQRVVAVVAAAGEAPSDATAAARDDLADALHRHQLPREVIVVSDVPRLASGKIDRSAARSLARRTGGS